MHRFPARPRPSARYAWRLLAVGAALWSFSLASRANEAPEPAGDGIGLSWSAFGTLGYAQSNRPWRYQGSIDEDGTVRRDTVLGGQLDAQLTPQWSATLQAKWAPSVKHESRWDLTAAWAFMAWRPNNDWLLRAGKLRVPFLLRSEHLDVGQTYDEARLPAELYTLAPTNDFTGAHLTRTWARSGGELSVEAYRGNADLTKRFWVRDGLPPVVPAGALFTEVNVTVTGLVLTWRAPETLARVGVHHARTRLNDGGSLVVKPVWAALGPSLGYWQTSNSLPGPGVQEINYINNTLLTAGAQVDLPKGWRLAGELMRVVQHDTENGVDTWGGYATVYRSIGSFTPYFTLAALHSNQTTLQWSRTLDATTLPGFVPGAAQLNASMRLNADTAPVYRQRSFALGTSYALTPRSKLKVEWLHTRANISHLIDVPAGEPLEQRRRVNVLSASYSFVF